MPKLLIFGCHFNTIRKSFELFGIIKPIGFCKYENFVKKQNMCIRFLVRSQAMTGWRIHSVESRPSSVGGSIRILYNLLLPYVQPCGY